MKKKNAENSGGKERKRRRREERERERERGTFAGAETRSDEALLTSLTSLLLLQREATQTNTFIPSNIFLALSLEINSLGIH